MKHNKKYIIEKLNLNNNYDGNDISDLFGKLKTNKTPIELKNEGKKGWE